MWLVPRARAESSSTSRWRPVLRSPSKAWSKRVRRHEKAGCRLAGVAMSTPILWKRYQQYLCRIPALGLTLDVSRMRFEDGFLDRMATPLKRAFEDMDALERGAIANRDENRMVGHYWLRAPDLAPAPDLAKEIRETIARIKAFATSVHTGQIKPPAAPRFTRVLSIGIGGSALGPMFVA